MNMTFNGLCSKITTVSFFNLLDVNSKFGRNKKKKKTKPRQALFWSKNFKVNVTGITVLKCYNK